MLAELLEVKRVRSSTGLNDKIKPQKETLARPKPLANQSLQPVPPDGSAHPFWHCEAEPGSGPGACEDIDPKKVILLALPLAVDSVKIFAPCDA